MRRRRRQRRRERIDDGRGNHERVRHRRRIGVGNRVRLAVRAGSGVPVGSRIPHRGRRRQALRHAERRRLVDRLPDHGGRGEDLKAKGLTINVGQSGTGGGFEKFCAGQTDFSNASRAIKDEEKAACEKAGVEFEEFKVASDGLAIVSSKETAIECLSIEELKKTFGTGSTVKKGTDIRADLPADDLKLFTPARLRHLRLLREEVLDKGKFRADDVTTSEDDNVLVTGISGTKGGLGFFGFAYFQENEAKLNLVGVKGDGECVKPSAETVLDGSYPLSRPLFVYVKKESLAKPETKAMMKYLLGDEGRAITTEVGYVELEDKDYADQLAKLGA
jgi:phosphate transport system substrate-binding protein